MVRRTATIKVGVSSNHEDLQRGFSRISGGLNRAMLEGVEEGTLRLAGAIRSGIPIGNPDPLGRQPGQGHPQHARDTWNHLVERTPRGGRGIVSSDDEIAFYYWSGTRPHPITAIRSRALRFFFRGHERFFANVWHPGTRPHPYVEEGGARAEADIKSRFDDAVGDVFDREDLRA